MTIFIVRLKMKIFELFGIQPTINSNEKFRPKKSWFFIFWPMNLNDLTELNLTKLCLFHITRKGNCWTDVFHYLVYLEPLVVFNLYRLVMSTNWRPWLPGSWEKSEPVRILVHDLIFCPNNLGKMTSKKVKLWDNFKILV